MIEKTRYFTYLFISLWKSILFFGGAWLIASTGSNSLLRHPSHMFDFDLFKDSFDSHWLNVSERMDVVLEGQSSDAYEELYMGTIMTLKNSPLWALLVQIGASYIAYIFAKFASKVQIQGFSFSFPLSAVVPICATLLLSACGARAKDRCAFHNFMPDYIFFEVLHLPEYNDCRYRKFHIILYPFGKMSSTYFHCKKITKKNEENHNFKKVNDISFRLNILSIQRLYLELQKFLN